MEVEQNNSIPFLDVQVTKKGQGLPIKSTGNRPTPTYTFTTGPSTTHPSSSQSPTHSSDEHTNSAIQTIFSRNSITSPRPSPPSTSIPGVRSSTKPPVLLWYIYQRDPPPPHHPCTTLPRQVIPPSSTHPERSQHPSSTHLIPQVTQHAPHTQGHSTTQQESRCIQNTIRMWKSLHRGNRQRHGHTTQRTQDQFQTRRMRKVGHRQARTTTRSSHHVGRHSTHHLHQQLEYTQS